MENELNRKQIIENIENIKGDNDPDRDYEPSEDSATNTDYESNELINENEVNTSNWLNISTNLNLSSTANAAGKSGCDNAHLTVKNSSSGIKKHYCLYCKLPQSKIARHLENVHSTEEDVMKFVTLPKGCLESVYKVARYDEETQMFGAVYTAFQLGTLLKEVGELWRSQCIKNHDPNKKYRAQAKIHPNNPYLFGIVGFHKQRHKYLRACDLMRKFANECNADNPERLRGTSDDSENDSDNSNDEDGNVFDDKNNSNDNNNNSSINLNSTITDDFINDGNSMQDNSSKRKRITNPNTNTKSKMQSRCKRIRWNNEEKQIVLKIFDTYLNTYKCPTNKEIAALINANSCLQTRTVNQVKAWFNNQQRSIRNNSQA
ncbi:PREDICTED: myb-like protein D [Trachymyrmex cornetzi]|uniref:myb-like protein D n=1 Tax=Trachymyrmex cornetzi TaxID=471704 RepID=UPI00084F2DC3|nr:PREDICTED: myb-like protein D [Trachymyrmex cornetzi]